MPDSNYLMHRFDIVYFMPELHNASIWYVYPMPVYFYPCGSW